MRDRAQDFALDAANQCRRDHADGRGLSRPSSSDRARAIPSQDGRGASPCEGTRGADGVVAVAFTFDLVSRQKFPDIEVGKLPRARRLAVCALGSYIRCSRWVGDGKDEAFIPCRRRRSQVQSWSRNSRHRPEVGVTWPWTQTDAGGIRRESAKLIPDICRVIKHRLDDGVVTAPAPRVEAASHASTRAIHWPGWVII